MIYVIMCGGTYTVWETPKQLALINGEPIVARTIRQLKEVGVDPLDIYITSNDDRFHSFGVVCLNHKNDYTSVFGKISGYWLDAFYPKFNDDQKVTFIFGDVCFTEDAIRKIVSYDGGKNVLFGTGIAANELHKNWGEPFTYVVNDYKTFMEGVRDVKKMQDEGKLKRQGLVWELYRHLNGLDVNVQQVLLNDTYFAIDDGTMDFDSPEKYERVRKDFEK